MWWMTYATCQTLKWCLKRNHNVSRAEVWIHFFHSMLCCVRSSVFSVRGKCTTGFNDYHGHAGTVLSASLALLQVLPMLAIKSLAQHAPAWLLSRIYITAAERKGQIRVILWPLLWCKLMVTSRCTVWKVFFFCFMSGPHRESPLYRKSLGNAWCLKGTCLCTYMWVSIECLPTHKLK